mmetsp:Transcript_23350/g.36531  ORF Transcript_23350/g.36531 Transcript_23350/m.36531 type:complete len:244 (-) Transcript_23350:140-871(-)
MVLNVLDFLLKTLDLLLLHLDCLILPRHLLAHGMLVPSPGLFSVLVVNLESLPLTLLANICGVKDLGSSTQHLVPPSWVGLLVVVPHIHYVPARARAAVLLGSRAVPGQDLGGRHALMGALCLTELDHEHWRAPGGSPQHLSARRQRLLLYGSNGDALLGEDRWRGQELLGDRIKAPVWARRVISVCQLDVVEEIRIDKLNRQDAASQDKHVSVSDEVADALPDHLMGVVHREAPLHGRDQDG